MFLSELVLSLIYESSLTIVFVCVATVLSEKPIAGCIDDARELLRYYGDLGEGRPMYFVAEHYRFEKAWLRASELVEQHCGKLVAASLVVHVPFSGTPYATT